MIHLSLSCYTKGMLHLIHHFTNENFSELEPKCAPQLFNLLRFLKTGVSVFLLKTVVSVFLEVPHNINISDMIILYQKHTIVRECFHFVSFCSTRTRLIQENKFLQQQASWSAFSCKKRIRRKRFSHSVSTQSARRLFSSKQIMCQLLVSNLAK